MASGVAPLARLMRQRAASQAGANQPPAGQGGKLERTHKTPVGRPDVKLDRLIGLARRSDGRAWTDYVSLMRGINPGHSESGLAKEALRAQRRLADRGIQVSVTEAGLLEAWSDHNVFAAVGRGEFSAAGNLGPLFEGGNGQGLRLVARLNQTLNSGFSKLPVYRGRAVRVVELSPQQLAAFRTGDLVNLRAPASATAGNRALDGWSRNTELHVDLRRGHDLRAVNPGEAEVVLPAGNYRVISVTPRNGGTVVHLIQQ